MLVQKLQQNADALDARVKQLDAELLEKYTLGITFRGSGLPEHVSKL